MQRYIRQRTFIGLGDSGQQKLAGARVAVVGIGALGTVTAGCLARAGIGFLRLIDPDRVERINLHRQVLFTESDADNQIPKALAAHACLSKANSEIEIEPVVAELNAENAETLLNGVDLVLDAVDRWEPRFIINQVCRKNSVPWIYCAALGAEGMTMNFLPKEQPCLQCVVAQQTLDTEPTCVSVGILNMTTGFIASIQSTEAVKILTGSPMIRQGLFLADVWNNRFKTLAFPPNPNCPVCGQ